MAGLSSSLADRFGKNLRAYWLALAAIVGVVLVRRFLLGDLLGHHAPLLLFVTAVMAAAWCGGLAPGLFATVLATFVGTYFFIEDRGFRALPTGDMVGIVIFLVAGTAVSCLSESLHMAHRRGEERQRQLEHEIAERTDMARALKDADRRKDEFLATLAHELRNPLAPLSYALQLWPAVAENASELEQLRLTMNQQVQLITRLIDDLLDVSRITRGKIHLHKRRLDLGTLVSQAVEGIRPLVESCGQHLSVQLPAEPLPVEGDPVRLSQVLGNVLHNATKYTGQGGMIWVVAQRQADRAVVSIRDNGPGIPRHMLGEIFEIFRQVDLTLDRSQGGLGIGLTLVKRLVEMHGGTIAARSEGPGTGSEFIITLPAAVTHGPEVESPCHVARHLARHRILVVDDVQVSADSLALLLRTMGQSVSVAYNGKAALDAVAAHRPDVVFIDIAMPGMNGYEVARRIRSHAELRGLSLVALTGYGQLEDRRNALEAGFDRHMTKPASMDALQEFLGGVPSVEQDSASFQDGLRA